MDRNFLKHLLSIPPCLVEGSCVCVGANLQQSVRQLIILPSYLCRASRSAHSENLGPSQIFPEHVHSPGHVHSLCIVWASRFPEMSWSFLIPLWASHSPAFLFKNFGSLIVYSNCYPLPHAVMKLINCL